MKICIISKYPPIEGGVSAQTYWLAKGLGKRGHEVFVVTNAWDIKESFKEEIVKEDLKLIEPNNVKVFSTNPKFLSPIPRGRYYTARIANLAIDIVRNYNVDIIHSQYILPYGIAGMMSKHATGKPLIIQHAGSDITRLFSSPELETLFSEVFRSADKIVGYRQTSERLYEHSIYRDNVAPIPHALNLEEFDPNVNLFDFTKIGIEDMPLFSYFGKISSLKKTYEFINAASKIKDRTFSVLFVTERTPNLVSLKQYIKKLGLEKKCFFLPFQAPWVIPSIMKASTCIVSPEGDETDHFPQGTHNPRIVREAMACGKCAIIGMEVSQKGIYRKASDMQHFIVVDPTNVDNFAKKLKFVVDNSETVERIGMTARKFSENNEKFEVYMESIENLYKSVLT